MFWSIVFSVLSVGVGMLTRPRAQSVTTMIPATADDITVPTAEENRPIPVLFGTRLIEGANNVWWGDLDVEAIDDSGVTVNYRYRFGAHYVLAHEVDSLLGLKWDNKWGWTGEQTGSGTIVVDKPTLFGREGGVKGSVDLCCGESAQAVNAYLAEQIDGPVSAYRGVASLVFRDLPGTRNVTFNWGTSPYPKQFSARCTRVGRRDGAQWYAEVAAITYGESGADAWVRMNPAHIVREGLTREYGGRGLPEGLVDDAMFRAAADTLYAEGFGLSFVWSSGDDIDVFLQDVLSHVDGVLSEDPETGLIGLRLLRDDYDVDALPVLGPDEIRAVTKYARPAWGDIVTEVQVTWTDPDNEERVVIERDEAAVSMQGFENVETLTMAGIDRAELAQTVAARELRQRSAGLTSVELDAGPEAEQLVPGDVFVWQWPEYGVERMVLRVLEVKLCVMGGGDWITRLICTEDVFGTWATSVGTPGGGWTPPITSGWGADWSGVWGY